jgi:hypothetical protein
MATAFCGWTHLRLRYHDRFRHTIGRHGQSPLPGTQREPVPTGSVNQKRTKIQPGGPLFVPLNGTAQESFEHFFF